MGREGSAYQLSRHHRGVAFPLVHDKKDYARSSDLSFTQFRKGSASPPPPTRVDIRRAGDKVVTCPRPASSSAEGLEIDALRGELRSPA